MADSSFDDIQRLWGRTSNAAGRVIRSFDLDRKFRSAQNTASRHPVLTLLILLVVSVLSVPVGLFVVFATGSIAFTFMGFMFVEGTILTLAGLVLGGILLVVCFFALTLGGAVFLLVYVLNTMFNVYNMAAVKVGRGASTRQPADPIRSHVGDGLLGAAGDVRFSRTRDGDHEASGPADGDARGSATGSATGAEALTRRLPASPVRAGGRSELPLGKFGQKSNVSEKGSPVKSLLRDNDSPSGDSSSSFDHLDDCPPQSEPIG